MTLTHIKSMAATFVGCLLCSTATVAQNSGDAKPIPGRFIPSRAIIIHGDPERSDSAVLAVFYSREGLDFNDADAPRFLLLDREGKVAFGIGGDLYATASYDFGGSVDSYAFTTYNIPVPNNPAQRERFDADARSSQLTAKLVGRTSRLGLFTVYFQARFNGNNGNYGIRLRQAYATLGHLTAGLATSSFVDAAAQAPTVDPQGACGQVVERNMLFRYVTSSYKGLTGAISVEVPKATCTMATRPGEGEDAEPIALTQKISQRVPDIPVYLQYSWAKGSHVRIAGIFRDLAYRDLVSNQNRLQPGWGFKFSTRLDIGIFEPFGHFSYGKGISTYVNDLNGNGFDLIPDADRPGRLKATPSMTWTAGTVVHFTPKIFATGSLSRAQVFGAADMGGETYRYAMYGAANLFYDFDPNFRLGLEYLHGRRTNYSGESGKANRLSVLIKYSF